MRTIIIIGFLILGNISFGQLNEAYDNISDSLIKIQKYDELIAYFKKELKKYPKNEIILRSIGYGYLAKNELAIGEKYYQDAIKVNPNCSNCYINIGRIYLIKKDNNKALKYFDKAISVAPNNAYSYLMRAKCKELSNDEFGALFDFDKAIELDNLNAFYYSERASFNLNNGYAGLAISDLNKAIKLLPENSHLYFLRSKVYHESRKFKKALIDINKAIEIDSSVYESYIARGAIYAMMKKDKKALAAYSKAISLNPDNYFAYFNRAMTHYSMENMDAACNDYSILEEFIKKGKIKDTSIIIRVKENIKDICTPNNSSYYFQRGVAFYNLGKYQQAITIYDKGLIKFPSNSLILAFKANAYYVTENYKKALEFYNLALKNKSNLLSIVKSNPRFSNASARQLDNYINGSTAEWNFKKAGCLLNLGSYNQALLTINEAIELIEGIYEFEKLLATAYNMRGLIYLQLQKYKHAMFDFDKSIRLDKTLSPAYVNRAIAKISLSEKVKITTYSINANYNNMPIGINWKFRNKSSTKKAKTTLNLALLDCDKAVSLNNDNGFAYYIRGKIKLLLQYEDYCYDIFRAKNLGVIIEPEFLKNCK